MAEINKLTKCDAHVVVLVQLLYIQTRWAKTHPLSRLTHYFRHFAQMGEQVKCSLMELTLK